MAEQNGIEVYKLSPSDPNMDGDKHALITAISTQFRIVDRLVPGETLNRLQQFVEQQAERGIDQRKLVACQMAQLIMGNKYLPEQWGQLKFDLVANNGSFAPKDEPGVYSAMIQSLYAEAMPSEQNQPGDFPEEV
jgi:hypothetical protein